MDFKTISVIARETGIPRHTVARRAAAAGLSRVQWGPRWTYIAAPHEVPLLLLPLKRGRRKNIAASA